ncbi:MAG: type VII toxin-antitoxin system HepT family RNase toxin [Candidatus Hodarchaeales archaeon]
MPLNKNFIKEQFVTSNRYLEKLKELNAIDLSEFQTNFDLQLMAERTFEVLTQIILDVCTHIVAHSNEPPPSSYSNCIETLSKLGIFNEEKTDIYSSMIKMRNLVTHRYGSVNYEILYHSLKKLEIDFVNFKNTILEWLSEEN